MERVTFEEYEAAKAEGAAVTSPKGKEHRAWENESISVCIMRTGRP